MVGWQARKRSRRAHSLDQGPGDRDRGRETLGRWPSRWFWRWYCCSLTGFSLGPSWIVPAVEALLLAAIVVADQGRFDGRSAAGRALSFALVAVLVAEAAGVSGRLVVNLIEGGPETNSASDLLGVGFAVWQDEHHGRLSRGPIRGPALQIIQRGECRQCNDLCHLCS